jgi:hypothetical protein
MRRNLTQLLRQVSSNVQRRGYAPALVSRLANALTAIAAASSRSCGKVP